MALFSQNDKQREAGAGDDAVQHFGKFCVAGSMLVVRHSWAIVQLIQRQGSLENRRAGISGIVMTFDVERKSSETHISCGVQGLFCSDVRATNAMLGRPGRVSLD